MCPQHSRHRNTRSAEMPEYINGVILANELSVSKFEVLGKRLASCDGCGGLANLMLHA